MREKRDINTLTIGDRLALLRNERHYKQLEFCKCFSEFMGASKEITIPRVSAWEQNRRAPSAEMIIQLSLFYGVSSDFILGLSDERKNARMEEKREIISSKIEHDIKPLSNYELAIFDHQPVYINFKQDNHLDQWGLLNLAKEQIICCDYIVKITNNINIYAYGTTDAIKTRICTRDKLLTTENIVVKMKSYDPSVRALYDGWYRHSPDKRCLVKEGVGLALKYENLDISYYAFRG